MYKERAYQYAWHLRPHSFYLPYHIPMNSDAWYFDSYSFLSTPSLLTVPFENVKDPTHIIGANY